MENNIKLDTLTRDLYQKLNSLYSNSYLVFSLNPTRHTIKDHMTLIFRGTYVNTEIVDNLFTHREHVFLKLIALGFTDITINIFDTEYSGLSNDDEVKTEYINLSNYSEDSDHFLINEYSQITDGFLQNLNDCKIRIRYFNVNELSNEYSFNPGSYDSLIDGTQFYIVKNINWDSVKKLFFLGKKDVSAGVPSNRQWITTQEFNLCLFINGLSLTTWEKSDIKRNMWILQGNRLKDLSVPDLFTYIKNTNIDVKKFTTSEKMYHNTFNNYIKNAKVNELKEKLNAIFESSDLYYDIEILMELYIYISNSNIENDQLNLQSFFELVETLTTNDIFIHIFNSKFMYHIKKIKNVIKRNHENENNIYYTSPSDDVFLEIYSAIITKIFQDNKDLLIINFHRFSSRIFKHYILNEEILKNLKNEIISFMLYNSIFNPIKFNNYLIKKFSTSNEKMIADKNKFFVKFIELINSDNLFSEKIYNANFYKILTIIYNSISNNLDIGNKVRLKASHLMKKDEKVYNYIFDLLNDIKIKDVNEISDKVNQTKRNLNRYNEYWDDIFTESQKIIFKKIISGYHIRNTGVRHMFNNFVSELWIELVKEQIKFEEKELGNEKLEYMSFNDQMVYKDNLRKTVKNRMNSILYNRMQTKTQTQMQTIADKREFSTSVCNNIQTHMQNAPDLRENNVSNDSMQTHSKIANKKLQTSQTSLVVSYLNRLKSLTFHSSDSDRIIVQTDMEYNWARILRDEMMKKDHSDNLLYKEVFKLNKFLSILLKNKRAHHTLTKCFPEILNEINSSEYILLALSVVLTYHNRASYATIVTKIGVFVLYNLYRLKYYSEFESYEKFKLHYTNFDNEYSSRLGKIFLQLFNLYAIVIEEDFDKKTKQPTKIIINEIYVKDLIECALVQPFSLPMVAQPLKWSDKSYGGFLINGEQQNDITTGSIKKHKHIIEEKEGLYNAINTLNSIKFRINNELLEFINSDGQYLLLEDNTKDTEIQQFITLKIASFAATKILASI